MWSRQLEAPVATLRAHAERLQVQVDGQMQAEAAREVASHIVEQADSISAWVGAILDVQRIRLGKMPLELREVDFVELARRCAADFQDTAVRFVGGGPTAWPVLADPGRLSHVLDCLLGSMARQSAGHSLELHIGAREWADGRPRAILCVKDTGQDLETHDLPRMLSHQTVLDLELYVAREVVRLHGGELWAEQRGSGEGGAAW
jgi:signal transduction histidine kinase